MDDRSHPRRIHRFHPVCAAAGHLGSQVVLDLKSPRGLLRHPLQLMFMAERSSYLERQ